MYIDEEKKFIFFHSFKTGGTTIENILHNYTIPKYGKSVYELMQIKFNRSVKHFSYAKLFELMPNENFDQYLKFCFIRNPYTKMYSYFLQIKRMADRGHSGEMNMMKEVNYEFNQFTKVLNGSLSSNIPYTYYQNQCVMDFIGRFENFEEDLQKVCEMIGVPYISMHANHKGDNDYLKFYTSQGIEIINKAAQKDFETFGYTMLDPNLFPEKVDTNNFFQLDYDDSPKYLLNGKVVTSDK